MTRRQFSCRAGAFAAAGALAACGRRLGTGFNGYALVATSGETSAAAVDLLTFRSLPPISLHGTRPDFVLAGTGGRAYALSANEGVIHVIGPNRKVKSSLQVEGGLTLANQTATGDLIAVHKKSGNLLLMDARNSSIRQRYPLPHAPTTLQVAPATVTMPERRQLVGALHGPSGTLSLIDLETGTVVTRTLGEPCSDIRFRADGRVLLAGKVQSRALTAFTVPRLETMGELPLAMEPDNLCFNPDGGQLFISGKGMDGVAIVFPDRVLQVDQTVLAGRDPGPLICSRNPQLLFVGSASGSDVCVLAVDTRKVIGLVDVGKEPSFLTITPDDQYVLILSQAGGEMAFIRVPAIRVNPAVMRGKSAASLFTVLPVGSSPVNAAVVPYVA